MIGMIHMRAGAIAVAQNVTMKLFPKADFELG